MSWIDAHVHLWTQDADRYPVTKGTNLTKFEPKNFLPEHLFQHTHPSNVSRVIIVQIGSYGPDNSLAIDALEQYPEVFRIVGMVDQHREDVAEEMDRLAKKGVTGFRISGVPGDPQKSLQAPAFDSMYRAAAKTDQVICPITMPPGLVDQVAMCRRHPDTKVVVDHMGRIGEQNPIRDDDVKTLCSLAEFPQVYVKISRLHSLGRKRPPHDDLIPMIRCVVDAFGPDRLMWGSDSPYQIVSESYEDSISVVRDKLDFLSTAEREQILAKTAERIFFW